MSSSTDDQEKQALVTSLRLLAATPKTRKALGKKLEEKGFRPEVVSKTLSLLEKQGLMNDRTLAQSLIQSFIYQRPSGKRRITFELERRGIGKALAQELLLQYSPEEERKQALELGQFKWEKSRKVDPLKRRKKVYDFLVRRGFDFAMARDIVVQIERGKA